MLDFEKSLLKFPKQSTKIIANKINLTKNTTLQRNIRNQKQVLPNKNIKKISSLTMLHAQTVSDGYNLVNNKSNVVFRLLNTSKKDIFILKNKNGIVYKSDNIWIAEYYLNNMLLKEKISIKF